jgi:hypothetical protein
VATNRVFFPQEKVDRWLADSAVSLEGEVLVVLPDGPAFLLTSAVRFGAEVAAGEDGPKLCGKVKTLAAIEALSGEYDLGSVVLGDYAYEVVDGFVGELLELAKEGWGAPEPAPAPLARAAAEQNPRSTHGGPPLRRNTGTSSQALRTVQSAKSGFSIPASREPGAPRPRPSRPAGSRAHGDSTPERTSSVSIAAVSLAPGRAAAPPSPETAAQRRGPMDDGSVAEDAASVPALVGARSALTALAELVSRG